MLRGLSVPLVFVVLSLLPSCCRWAKRDCFPPCPDPEPIHIHKPCELPGPLELPAIHRTRKGCPEALACFDATNAAGLAIRDAAMKEWIKSARARCGGDKAGPGS